MYILLDNLNILIRVGVSSTDLKSSSLAGEKDHYNINLEDEVVRGSIILKDVSSIKYTHILG